MRPADTQAVPRFRPLTKAEWRSFGLILFPLLTAIGAQIQVPLPPFGVPMTLQTLAVLLCAIGLGGRWGALAMAGYLAAGAMGAGVFSEGRAGLGVLFGQTGGYLLGFVLCQPAVSAIVRRKNGAIRGWLGVVTAVLAAETIIFAVGVPWLFAVRNLDANLEPISAGDALYGGLVVFLPGTILKTALAVLIARWALPWTTRNVW
ncbi:MAG: biotin transporter BioY [Phycisphaeraceae bacterium]|nr:biotin transporter BioY [Phycisphaeraceae bacterium]